MNKLILNNKSHNFIKFYPLNNTTIEGDDIEWCKSQWDNLLHTATINTQYSNKQIGYLITTLSLGSLYYLVQCLRGPNGQTVSVYINNNKEDNESIAKFLNENLKETLINTRKQLEDILNNDKGTQHTA